jgi:hypothetical protein
MAKLSEPKWVLMIPFITAPGFPFKESRTVAIGRRQAEVRPASFDYTQITVDGIESVRAAAYGLFEAVRIGLFVASLNLDWSYSPTRHAPGNLSGNGD